MDKSYTKKKYRRKIPKVGRSYERHMSESKTFDKSINDLVEELFLEKADKIPGGLAQGKSPKDFDKKALEAGIKVEMEHTSDLKVATEIAMDHLTEDPKYYEKLKTIEKSMYKMCKACGTDLCDGKECLMKKQGVPKGADPATHERCVKDVKKQGKDKSSAYAICNAAGAGMKKSIDEMIDEVLDYDYSSELSEEENLGLDEICKSFGYDEELISDYLETDSDEDADSLEKAKTVSRNGMRYYSDGPHAGKLVGSVRGDKASAKAVERARKKGKVSAQGAKQGIKEANQRKKYQDRRESTRESGYSLDRDMQSIKRRAARKLATEKEGGFGSKKAKERAKQSVDKISQATKEDREKMKAVEENKVRNKDGSERRGSKKNKEMQAQYDEAKASKDKKTSEWGKEVHRRAKETGEKVRNKKKEKELRAKQEQRDKKADRKEYSRIVKEETRGISPTNSGAHRAAAKRVERRMSMNKSIVETEIEQMADQMAKSTQDPKLELIETIKELGAEGLKKALPELSDSQKELVKSVLEEISKGKQDVAMDANYDGDKKFAKLAEMGTEVENGSDDEDEKLMMQSAASHNPQGDVSPEGREGQVIKGEKMEEKKEEKAGKKVAEAVDEMAEGEAEEVMEEHEKEMHKKKMNKSLEELQALKEEVIKSYEDAGLSYNDELVKSEMKKRLLKEEDQVEMGGQDKGGKKDRADKKSEPEIEVAKDADETADEATAKVGKMKKSLPEFDTQANLRANTLGRNHHFSVNDYYDQVLAKSEESEGEENSEELSKSEKEDDLNDIIAKGYDKTMTDVDEEELHKSQVKGKFAKSSFSDKDLADAFGMTEEEYNKMLNQ